MISSRAVAIDFLYEILEKKVFFSDLKDNSITDFQKIEKFVTMLVFTSLRKKIFIENILKSFLRKPIAHKDIFVHYALLCASTELLFMNTPDYAIVNEYVKIVKQKKGQFLSSMVNAVLHKIANDKNNLLKLDTCCDFPKEFKENLIADYGSDIADKIEKVYANKASIDLTLMSPIEDFSTKTGAIKNDDTSYSLSDCDDIKNVFGFSAGKFIVQDYAASLPVKLFDNLLGKHVLDLCAAPGGKTAQLLSVGATVTAVDISEARLKKLKENIKRINFSKLNIVCEDAFTFLQNSKDKFDAILLDAPCSATGTFRKHPEVPHLKNIKDIRKMAAIQKQMLSEAVNCLSDNGELVYCVCSIFKSEGEEIIADFLQNNKNYMIVSKSLPQIIDNQIITKDGYIRTLPFYGHEMDGFFAAKIIKKTHNS